MTLNDSKLHAHLGNFSLITIIFFVALRSYAAFFTQTVVAHDDKHYRAASIVLGNHLSTPEAVKEVLLPTSRHLRERTIGYISWLVLGQKLFTIFPIEIRWQIVNLSLFSMQLLCVYFLSLWASEKKWFSSAVTALYISMPMIFGMNRWIMTENFVFAALVFFPICAVMVLDKSLFVLRHEANKRFGIFFHEICLPFLSAVSLGIFSRLREYALPSLIAVALVIVITFIFEKRWLALFIFAAFFLPFFIASSQAAFRVISYTIQKTGIIRENTHPDVALGKYFSPWYDWGYRIVFRTLGLSMTAFLGLGLFSITRGFFRNVSATFSRLSTKTLPRHKSNWLKGIHLLFLSLLGLTAFYGLAVLSSPSRTLRIPMLPALTFLTAVFLGIKILNSVREYFFSPPIKSFLAALLVFSWITMLYQLFFSFGGGKHFVVRPYYMETYNHPLNIRKLAGPGDWHVVED